MAFFLSRKNRRWLINRGNESKWKSGKEITIFLYKLLERDISVLNKIRSKHLVESNYITSHFCSLEILNFLMEQKKKMIFCTCILNAVQGKGIDHVKSGLGTACPRGWRQWPISATEILERATRGRNSY